jgi:hypothetical protein
MSLSITVSLLYDLHTACTEGMDDCSIEKFPTISRTIASKEEFNRVFLLLVTGLMYGVYQAVIRSFFKMLYGVIDTRWNDLYLIIGTLAVVSLPMIGIFDCIQYSPIHVTFAVIFFGATGIYMTLVGRALYFNRDKFSADKQRAIDITMLATYGIYITLGALLITSILYGGGIRAICEWITGIYFMNFLAIIGFTNTFYETVHDKDEL